MRKIVGLLFVTLTLAAGSANAQGTFLHEGYGGVGAYLGGATIKDAWTLSVVPSYTYRGMFDVGIDVTRYAFVAGNAKNLSAIGLQPFARAYLLRFEDGESPVSVTADLGVQKRLYMGNGNAPNPDGWGLYVGGSAFRRFDFSDNFAAIPELFVAYDMRSTTWHSASEDQTAVPTAQRTDYKHGVRAYLRFNMGVRKGKTMYTITPYLGFNDGLAAGANLGMIF